MDAKTEQATRINGPHHGAWPEVTDGIYTGRYFHVIEMPDGERMIASKADWKSAKPA